MIVELTFGARALVASNDGLDPIACAERYAAAVRDALRREWPDATITVSFTDDRAATHVTAPDPATERTALDLAWVIRQTHPWASP